MSNSKQNNGMSEEAKSILDFYLYDSEAAVEFWEEAEKAAAKYEIPVDYYLAEFC
jgi:hypothetical protein